MKGRYLISAASICLAACAGVLGLRAHSEGRPFEHRTHAIQGVGCTECHTSVQDADSDAPIRWPTTADCVRCHTEPHEKRRCRDCHGLPNTDHFAQQARFYLTFSHRQHQASESCVRCHSGVQRDGQRLLPKMADCLGCHEHSNEFELRACDRCHKNLESEDIRPESHVVHGPDFTVNHSAQAAAQADLCSACHQQKECGSCHGAKVPMLSSKRDFVRPKTSGIHRANFQARHALAAKADPGLCVSCHRTDSCQRCHDQRNVSTDASSPHPPGWVGLRRNDHGPAARRDPVACASCHGGAKESLCVSCHAVGGIGGNPHPVGWSSSKRKTKDRPCTLCHLGS